ncbi:N-acetyltransferase [Burkholderia stagnalis]|uniref:N-acetyltransferase n=1 Tax=Burkholderia stagnalis TaxID=1503054 RepID=UPI000F5631F7|nr:N-acetyltransferase [Burkholderia stagnalis]RQQ19575.1 N-acetyltransferase [Burkholderia stagnalis]RQQ21679.1 N-acetyltransferase [Burkholderia stagnalis]RQQ40098.1 N-acetyltransferase [Burkholderia stagnalis]RQY41003.1 N-acetyltransferase [Burkholderia stagnalis]
MHDLLLGFEKFKDISLGDPFFESLKSDYDEFGDWFLKKGEHQAYTFRNKAGLLDGFLYLKRENGPVLDSTPPLPSSRRLKIGTFKINPHGTRLGERFIKRAFDVAVHERVDALYVTIFAKHEALVDLFFRYGFLQQAIKQTANGQELVLERRLDLVFKDVVLDYPRIPIGTGRHFVLSLYPQWHSRLLPDSLLRTENSSILQDISHTNSIHKIYLAAMSGVEQLQRGDTLLIYRTAEGGSAYYTSVVTSLCVVEELTNVRNFATVEQFLAYCAPYSIFSELELRNFYKSRRYPWVIRFTYNLALHRRPNRKALVEQVGINPGMYWGFFQISTPQLKHILQLSSDYEKASSLVYSS